MTDPISLSAFMRNSAERHFEGPIPADEQSRIRVVADAERSFARSLTPIQSAERSLSFAWQFFTESQTRLEASAAVAIEERAMLDDLSRRFPTMKTALTRVTEECEARAKKHRAIVRHDLEHVRDCASKLLALMDEPSGPEAA